MFTPEQLASMPADVRAEIESMQVRLQRAEARTSKDSKGNVTVVDEESGLKITLKVSDKGAVSIYGFGRFPVTIYPKQLKALLNSSLTIRDFIKNNSHLLSWEKKAAAENTEAA